MAFWETQSSSFEKPPRRGEFMGRMREAGAGFRSLMEAVDTTGRMVMQMLGGFAEFLSSSDRWFGERTRVGLAAARDCGAREGGTAGETES
jgi:DNA invertase Pin-like site-specific DNA recombinase